MKILNLFAGIGGNRTLWGDKHKITAVESDPNIAEIYRLRFPNDEMIVGDAYEYCESNFDNFDIIWASPPCQSHTRINATWGKKKKIPDFRLYALITFLRKFHRGNWLVENVIPYYPPPIKPTYLLDRHYFWSNISVPPRKFKRISVANANKGDLAEHHGIDINYINDLPSSKGNTHDFKRQVLRNCVNCELASYIMSFLLRLGRQQTLLFKQKGD